jgi:hypothetical protein
VVPAGDIGDFPRRYLAGVLPYGLFFALDRTSDKPVATAEAVHNAREGMFPFDGELGWVATIPSH